jgi:hypothetical protein
MVACVDQYSSEKRHYFLFSDEIFELEEIQPLLMKFHITGKRQFV